MITNLAVVIPDNAEHIGIWIAAFLTLCIYSFLYTDNPFYKFAEYLFVGVSAGYWVARQFHNSLKPNLINKLVIDHNYLYIIPGILGIMMLMRLVPSVSWLSRWSIAFVVGMSAGINIIANLQGNVISQIRGSIVPLWTDNIGTTINNWVLLVGLTCALIYFFFSVEHKGFFGGVSLLGIWFLMISFGASFGYTIMARISLLIGRMQFLLGDWLQVIKI